MIFNDPRFHALNGVEATTYGCLTGVWHDGVFENGYSAPFAGFDIPDDTPTWRVQEMAEEAFRLVYSENQSFGIRIKLPPPCYTPTWHAQVKALLDIGFRVERAEINQHVDEFSSLSRNGSRALKAAQSLELDVLELDARGRRMAYDLIAENRAAKGRTLRLSFDYLERARRFDVRWYGVYDKDMVAAAVTYKVRDGVTLVVYWGDKPDHDLPCSPMPLLAHRLWSKCGSHVLDLGISTDPGLMQFKRSVGAKDGLRLDMVRGL